MSDLFNISFTPQPTEIKSREEILQELDKKEKEEQLVVKTLDPLSLQDTTYTNDKGATAVVDSHEFCERIANAGYIMVTDSYPDGVYYDESLNLWRHDNVISYIMSFLIPQLTKNLNLASFLTTTKRKELANEILSMVKTSAQHNADVFNIAKAETKEQRELQTLVPFKNGMYDFITNTIIPRKKEHYVIAPFNAEPEHYEGESKIVEWLKYLTGDAYLTLCQYIGYTFVRTYEYSNSMLILTDSKDGTVREGGNGKSWVLKMIQNAVLRAQYSVHHTTQAIPLSQLTKSNANGTLLAGLRGAYANIDGDADSRYLEDTSTLKRLTGSDVIYSDIKYQSPISFYTHAKLYFAINKLPNFNDLSDGFADRLLIVPFKRNLRHDKEQRDHANSLYDMQNGHDQEEINKFVWFCLQEWRKLWIKDGKPHTIDGFYKNKEAEIVQEVWNTQNDKYTEFWEEEYELTENEDDFVTVRELRDSMKYYLAENGYKSENLKTMKAQIFKVLKVKHYKDKSNNGDLVKKIDGKTTKIYRGIRKRNEYEDIDDLIEEIDDMEEIF